MSISLQFNFTIGNGIALAIISSDFPSKFGTNMSFHALDAHQFLGIKFFANVFKISYFGETKISKSSNVLKDGVNLTSWIEYEPSSKRLEVRLSKLDDPKPVEPLILVSVDLEEMLKGEEVGFGLACSSERHENSTSWVLYIKELRQWETYFGDLQDHVVVPFPPMEVEHPSVESYKEDLWFTSAIVCGVIFLAALIMIFVLLYAVDEKKVQAVGYKHGTTDQVKKNSEIGMK
ncbi:uncharacterized protein LOC143531629 [Bidens hawaiensis]|uniref:uncharacterized protein LOC143531629 n=1 Tax=Bidens hawaiensis TaxID=980011 RepID=UPI00404ADD36